MPADNFEFKISYTGTGNFSWSTGSTNVASQSVSVSHRFPVLAFPDFSDFRLRVFVNFYNTSIEWLNVTGVGFTDGIKYPLGINSVPVLNFANLDLLPSGVYEAEIVFFLEGNLGTHWTGLESRELTFKLNVANGNPIKTEKDLYSLYYNKITNTISGDTGINIINNNENVFLDFEGDGSTLVAGGIFQTYFDLIFSSPALLPSTGEYVINAFIRKLVGGNYQRVYNFKIKIVIIDADIIINPSSLYFKVRKTMNEIKSETVTILDPKNLNNVGFNKPSWLNVSSIDTRTLVFSNIPPINLPNGKQEGIILFNYNNGVNNSIPVPVTLEVISFYTHNFNEQYNFCLDNKDLIITKNLENARFVRVTATMKFRTAEESKELVVPYIVPYFKDQVKLEIGKKIHQYFLKNRTSIFEEGTLAHNFDNRVHLYPCEASFKIEELDINQLPIYEESFSGIKFYPGKKPKFFPFMTNFGVRSRVYNSKHIFSFISGLVTPEELLDVNVSKNGLEDGCIARVKVERQENKITWSDEKAITAGGQTLQFYNIIEGKDVINVQWENQNLSPESFTFKGISTKPKDYTHLFQDNVFTGESEKFDTTGVKTINVSTGYILKTEEGIIDEIMYSKFCVLEFDGKFLKATASSSKLVYEDKSKMLIEFDLEFKINGN